MPDYIRSRSTMQLRSMEYKFRQHLLHHNTSFNASSMSELKMRLASGLFIRNKMAFLAIDEPFGIRIMYKNDSLIVISLLRSPNESTHMMDKTWTGQLFAYRKTSMFTGVDISGDTTPLMKKTHNDFYFGFERQY